jgi:predicted NBD/HSP70 family sugar kinase
MERIFGLGVGLWGSVDSRGGVVYSWTETPELYATWKDFALQDALKAMRPYPHVCIDDVVRTMGLAEVLYGAQAAINQDFLFALADTGIGVAIMINGEAYVGPNQLSGEIGHIPVGGSQVCSCGNTGCMETMASTRAILEQASRKSQETPTATSLSEINGSLSINQVIRAADAGDKVAYQVMTEAGEKFGIGLAMAINMFGPRLVIVGGALASSNAYLEAAKRMVRYHALGKANNDLSIQPSRLDRLAGARGAASLVLNRLFAPGEKNLLGLNVRLT